MFQTVRIEGLGTEWMEHICRPNADRPKPSLIWLAGLLGPMCRLPLAHPDEWSGLCITTRSKDVGINALSDHITDNRRHVRCRESSQRFGADVAERAKTQAKRHG